MSKESFFEPIEDAPPVVAAPSPYFEKDVKSRITPDQPVNKSHFASKEGVTYVKTFLEKGLGQGFTVRGFAIDAGATVPQRFIEIVQTPSGRTGVFVAGLIADIAVRNDEARATDVVRTDFFRDAPKSDED